MAKRPSTTLPRRAQDLAGRRFGNLVALTYSGRKGQQAVWACKCDCGVTKTVYATNLLRGLSRSCGCRKSNRGAHRGACQKHVSEYSSYRNMLGRCLDSRADGYDRYGGRGIAVCDRWVSGEGGLSGFECFLADMGEKATPGLTIDRRDSNGDYTPANCRWSTMKTQQNNRRNNRRITVDGVTKTITEWAQEAGLTFQAISGRLRRGWSPELAVKMKSTRAKW